MLTNKEILKQVQLKGAKETYAVRVWTRDEVDTVHMDLIAQHKVDSQELSDSEKDDILKRFQNYGDSNWHHEMTWKTLKDIVKEFLEEREDY